MSRKIALIHVGFFASVFFAQTVLGQQSLSSSQSDQKKLQQQKVDELFAKLDAASAKAHSVDSARNQLTLDYALAIQKKVTSRWIVPTGLAGKLKCEVDIVQQQGGQVLSANVEPSCPFDATTRKSVETAAMNSSPLPYAGYERVFSKRVVLSFISPDHPSGTP